MQTDKRFIPLGKKFRDRLNLSREDVIEDLLKYGTHISTYTLRNYETGTQDMPLTIMHHLCHIYDCTINQFLAERNQQDDRFKKADYVTYDLTKDYMLIVNKHQEKAYDIKSNIKDDHEIYAHAILGYDCRNTLLPEGSRLIYQASDKYQIKLKNTYDYYIISKTESINGKSYEKTFVTKAKEIEDSTRPKLVQYFFDGKVEHIASTAFLKMVEGLVVKIIIDVKK